MARNDDSPPQLFKQYGLDNADWQTCLRFVKKHYPEYGIDGMVDQGGCSYTARLKLLPTDQIAEREATMVVQFRPLRYALSTEVISAAKHWYGHLAPSTGEVGRVFGRSGVELVVYRSLYVPGERFDSIQPRQQKSIGPDLMRKYRNLLDDLANFYSTAWTTGLHHERQHLLDRCDGKVGSSIAWRLERLENDLPTLDLRSIAAKARADIEFGVLDRLPIVFTHGDLLPSNILVDEQTWHINGLIDWAESECLPFGMSLYGLEHLLGYLSTGKSTCKFKYLNDAASLRPYFWQRLIFRVPELRERRLCEAVELARVVGVLLWRGFAWDDGKIDRVVDPVGDAEELAYLEAFLDGNSCPRRARL